MGAASSDHLLLQLCHNLTINNLKKVLWHKTLLSTSIPGLVPIQQLGGMGWGGRRGRKECMK